MITFLITFCAALLATIIFQVLFEFYLKLRYKRIVFKAVERDEREFINLLTEFDEMGYAPTTFCDEPEKEAQEFKKRLIEIYNKKA